MADQFPAAAAVAINHSVSMKNPRQGLESNNPVATTTTKNTPQPTLSSLASTPIPSPTTRKRPRSSSTVEIFNLSIAYDTKRARIGIQELSTDPTPRFLPPQLIQQANLNEGPETDSQHGAGYSSSGLASSDDNEGEDSASSSDESSGAGFGDEGYDSDSESGSTTTSSSSSSSDDDSSSGQEGGSSSRSVTIGFPSPEQVRTSIFGAAAVSSSPCGLAKRLRSFIPQLAAANAQLDDERVKGILMERNIERISEDEERYIEMDLGLGVLEERQDRASHGSDNDGDESEAGSGISWTKGRSKKQHDAMSVLMGKRVAKKPEIQVLGAGN